MVHNVLRSRLQGDDRVLNQELLAIDNCQRRTNHDSWRRTLVCFQCSVDGVTHIWAALCVIKGKKGGSKSHDMKLGGAVLGEIKKLEGKC